MLGNFVILGTQRTGSTALYRALNFHRDIACGDEWTLRTAAHRKIKVTERALSGDFSVLLPRDRMLIGKVFSPDTRWLGFKLLFRSSNKWLVHPRVSPALWLDRFEPFVAWFAARPRIHVIHIVREDPIEWLKSKYVSDRAKAHSVKAYPEQITVEIPIRQALKRLVAKRWVDSRLAGLAGSNPYLKISYEEFLRSDRATVAAMLEFLRCDPSGLGQFDYRKQIRQSNRSARKYVSNYDQLVEVLGQEGFLGAGRH